MIIEAIAIVGVLFFASPDGMRSSQEALVFADMATCKAANVRAEISLGQAGFQVRTLCIDTGIKVKMRIEGKAS